MTDLLDFDLSAEKTWEQRLVLAKASRRCAWCGEAVEKGRTTFCSKDHSRRYHAKRMQRIKRERNLRDREMRAEITGYIEELREARREWGKLERWTLRWDYKDWRGRWYDEFKSDGAK